MLTQLYDDLWETEGESPFPGLTTHAYLWTGSTAGNVLFYSPVSERDLAEIQRLGGVSHHYLSHQDEAGPMVRTIRERFGPTLHAGRGDADRIGRFGDDIMWIDQRGTYSADVEVIPTPGHTPGSICFLVRAAGGLQYLFTGDTIFRDRAGAWQAGRLGFSDPVALASSLELLAALQPDVVISSAAPSGVGAHDIRNGPVWSTSVQEALTDLR